MSKYTKAVLTVIALSVLALPVKAEEKVWYCEMTGFARTSVDGVTQFEPEKFKIKVTRQKVSFGNGGYFNKTQIPVTYFSNLGVLEAGGEITTLILDNGVLNFSVANSSIAVAITAQCDDF